MAVLTMAFPAPGSTGSVATFPTTNNPTSLSGPHLSHQAPSRVSEGNTTNGTGQTIPLTPPTTTKRKRWAWLQRDSLASRMFIGKPGSRRRNRHDNIHFIDHPLAPAADPNFVHEHDRVPGGYVLPRKATIFSSITFSDHRKLLVNITPDDLYATNVHTSDAHGHGKVSSKVKSLSMLAGESNLNRSDRRMCQTLRRTNCDAEMLHRLEYSLVEFIKQSLMDSPDPWTSRVSSSDIELARSIDSTDSWGIPNSNQLEDGWVHLDSGSNGSLESSPSESDSVHMKLEITSSFLRLIIHIMCRYYQLGSSSENDLVSGKRVTTVQNPFVSSRCSDLMEDAPVYTFPSISFTDFMLSGRS
ncbi:hypothetical protein BASA50_000705 [Batrachochytrium salamandrivorans]|uniref:Uncharacterized protein n=1 Tax=Batrachochytrium salamandrivorans TaxID=1357716 RepID=A0ABQ8ETC6_9FUNG|nr:hypothetical protein BASA50_000705 [Batrachochytrium salamandrivorans]